MFLSGGKRYFNPFKSIPAVEFYWHLSLLCSSSLSPWHSGFRIHRIQRPAHRHPRHDPAPSHDVQLPRGSQEVVPGVSVCRLGDTFAALWCHILCTMRQLGITLFPPLKVRYFWHNKIWTPFPLLPSFNSILIMIVIVIIYVHCRNFVKYITTIIS